MNISPYQIDIIKSFALFYLLIFSNYLSRLFTCYQDSEIKRHRWFPFLLGFILFYFLVTHATHTEILEYVPPLQKFIYTVFYYLLFILSLRLDTRILLSVIALLFVFYFIELNKTYYFQLDSIQLNPKEKESYDSHHYWITLDWPVQIRWVLVKPEHLSLLQNVEAGLYYLMGGLLVVGIIAYIGEIKETMRNKRVDFTDILWNTNICKVKERKNIGYYFQKGLQLNTRK